MVGGDNMADEKINVTDAEEVTNTPEEAATAETAAEGLPAEGHRDRD